MAKKDEEKKVVPSSEEEVEKSEEELKADSEAAQAQLKKQNEEKKTATTQVKPEGEVPRAPAQRMYTADEVRAMLQQVAKGEDPNEDDDEAEKPKLIRLPRFMNKFILGFKNMNTDEYFPDQVIHAYDLWDNKTRQNVAWVTLRFDNEDELAIPLASILKKAQTVKCELVKVHEEDASYNFGKVERSEVDEYNKKGTGDMVQTKVTQKKYTYELKLPTTGKLVIVGPEVINW